MQKSPAWKLALLDDALPKFTAAIQACQHRDDTTEIKAPARTFIKLVQEIVFPGETQSTPEDPQETSNEDKNEIQGRQVIQECKDLNQLALVYESQCAEELKKLDTQVSQFEKMLEQFGKVLEFGYLRMIETVELKKEKIKDHLEANKDTVKLAFERILVILEEAR